ncbi:dienelactone hydrolase [Lophiotrema nucula]|uniref:Dienelactone hydrolase n=1 Tax=Lophiotrema nucula TaxID=690887 RepID=A0A6A5ZE79_9PLEO|nr:dienelactone hydrolase [Lophiotrema nucula]
MACPDCFRGGKATGDPIGDITTIHGLKTYVAGKPGSNTSESTIIFYTDAFGLDLVNNKLLADAYATATGFKVLIPDIIPGGPMSPDVMPIMDEVMEPVGLLNVPGQLKRAFKFFQAVSYFAPFFWRAFPSSKNSFTPCLDFARKIKAELPQGAKLGVAGFCWGGYQSINLSAQTTTEGGSEKLIDASFSAHPSGLNAPADVINAITKLKTPVSIAHAEDDFALPTAKILEAEATLRQQVGAGDGANGVHYQIKVYPKVGHGFAVRAKPGSNEEADGADEAKEQAVEWFKKWL